MKDKITEYKLLIFSLIVSVILFLTGYFLMPVLFNITNEYPNSISSGLTLGIVGFILVNLKFGKLYINKRLAPPILITLMFIIIFYLILGIMWTYFRENSFETLTSTVFSTALLSSITSYESYLLGYKLKEEDQACTKPDSIASIRSIFTLVALISLTLTFLIFYNNIVYNSRGQSDVKLIPNTILRLAVVSSFGFLGITDYCIGLMACATDSFVIRNVCGAVALVLGFYYSVLSLSLVPVNLLLPPFVILEPLAIAFIFLILQKNKLDPTDFFTTTKTG